MAHTHLTASAVVNTGLTTVRSVTLTNRGQPSTDFTVTARDGTTVSGPVVFIYMIGKTDDQTSRHIIFPNSPRFTNGIYVEIAGTGDVVVHWG